MTLKTPRRKKAQQPIAVRQATIPDDLSYMTDTEFGQEMLKLVTEIAAEQGTRTTEEINQLIGLVRESTSANTDLSEQLGN
jgi:hypothetical protein